ncbi:MAG: hypothetical protein OXH59_00475, partial [Rhodospirillaceae bacterium]|nr:hypothetical protein [Rhodospirillaceae bacterium]
NSPTKAGPHTPAVFAGCIRSKAPLHARSRIAINEMAGLPDDQVAERAIRALDDTVVAKAFADEPTVMDEEAFGKPGLCRDVFTERGLLRSDAGDVEPGASDWCTAHGIEPVPRSVSATNI